MTLRWLPLLLLVPLAAPPADAGLPVAYDAELAPLKAALRIGDPVTFSLFATPDCSGDAAHSESFAAGGGLVTIEEVKPVAAKRERPKPAKVARLRAELDVELIEDALFLRVDGAGIEAAGEACQVQVAGVVGAPGPPGPTLRWVDAEGTAFARVLERERAFLEPFGLSVVVAADDATIGNAGGIYYESADCTGDPLTNGPARFLIRAGARYFRTTSDADPTDFTAHSQLDPTTAECTALSPLDLDTAPATEIFPTGPGFTEPLVAPLHVELRS